MKVCLVTNLYGRTARGGAERVVEQEAAALVSAGHEVTVVTADRRPSEEPGNPRVVRLAAPNIYFYPEGGGRGLTSRFIWHLLDIFNLAAAWRLGRILEEEKPDVVHTHNLMGLGFLVPRRVRRLGLRHIHTVHDVQLLHPSGLLPVSAVRLPLPTRLARSAYRFLMRRLMGSPDKVIFPSEYLRRLHDGAGFFPASDRLVLRNPAPVLADAGPRSGEPVFLFAGQLERHKGILDLIAAWRSWEGRRGRLEIAGAGSLEPEVRQAAAGDTVFLGRLDRQQMDGAIGRARYLVVPSLVIENAPTVILEALARGTPVVAAAAGGIPELVSDGDNGFLFRPGDRRELSAALGRAAASLDDWPALSRSASAAAAGWGIDRHLQGLFAVYGR